MKRIERAVELFGSGHACSQAVLMAWAPDLGLDEDTAMRASAGFAAGMRLGSTCGAVTGAVMVVGLSVCGPECATREGRAVPAAAVTSFATRFEERLGSLDCPVIIGCDLRDPAAAARALEHGLFASRCARAVRAAMEILEDMLAPS